MIDILGRTFAMSWMPFVLATVVSAVFAWPIFKLLLALKSRQTVSQHVPEHAAKQGTPTMGGLIFVPGFLAVCLAAALARDPSLNRLYSGYAEWSIPVLFLGYLVIGFVDDFVVPRLMKGKRGLGWTQKLVMQIAIAVLAIMLGGPDTSALNIGVAVFLVVFFTNAYNFADGLDWLAGTILVALVAGLALLAMMGHADILAFYLAGLVGAGIPFLVLNRPPAKIFMGDVGALPIGAVLGYVVAVIAMPSIAPALHNMVLSGNGTVAMWPAPSIWLLFGLVVVSLMMVYELVPVPLQILSVKLRKGKRLFLATPIHHAYQRKGWAETRVVKVFFAWQVAFSIIAVAVAFWGMQREEIEGKQADLKNLRQMQQFPPIEP